MQSLEGKTDGQIEVTLEVTNKLYIRLLDNGRGIPMELQEKIFVPFFTTKTEGTGIGLSLCRQIIKKTWGQFLFTGKQTRKNYICYRMARSFFYFEITKFITGSL